MLKVFFIEKICTDIKWKENWKGENLKKNRKTNVPFKAVTLQIHLYQPLFSHSQHNSWCCFLFCGGVNNKLCMSITATFRILVSDVDVLSLLPTSSRSLILKRLCFILVHDLHLPCVCVCVWVHPHLLTLFHLVFKMVCLRKISYFLNPFCIFPLHSLILISLQWWFAECPYGVESTDH